MKHRGSVGKISFGGIVLVVLAVAGIYFGFQYLPVLMHRMSIGDVARETAAKMQVEHDHARLGEMVRTEVKSRTGVQVGMSDLQLQRKQPGNVTVVTIKWTEQVKHIWGTNHVLKMEVTEQIEPGKVRLKNAE